MRSQSKADGKSILPAIHDEEGSSVSVGQVVEDGDKKYSSIFCSFLEFNCLIHR